MNIYSDDDKEKDLSVFSLQALCFRLDEKRPAQRKMKLFGNSENNGGKV